MWSYKVGWDFVVATEQQQQSQQTWQPHPNLASLHTCEDPSYILWYTRWGCFNDPTQGWSTMLNILTLFYICFNSNSW